MGNDNNQKKPKPIYSLLKRLSHRKRWVVGAVVLTLFIGGALTAWLITPKTTQKSAESRVIEERAESIDQTVNDAQKLAHSDKADEAKKVYDNAINSTDDPYKKSILLISKATLYFDDGEYDEALNVAKEAETANQNTNVTGFIARLYEENGEDQKAIEYYQKSIELVNQSNPSARSDIKYYQNKIDILSATEGTIEE